MRQEKIISVVHINFNMPEKIFKIYFIDYYSIAGSH